MSKLTQEDLEIVFSDNTYICFNMVYPSGTNTNHDCEKLDFIKMRDRCRDVANAIKVLKNKGFK